MYRLALYLIAICPLFAQTPAALPDEPRVHLLGINGPLTPASGLAPREAGRAFLASTARQMGLAAPDLADVFLVKEYRTAHNGVTNLVFRQRFQGIEVQNAEWVVNLDRDGRVLNAGGTLYPAPSASAVPDRAAASRAVRTAASAVNPRLGARYTPSESPQPVRRPGTIRYAAGEFGADIEGRLTWYGLRGSLQPAWEFVVTDAGSLNRSLVVVDDATQNILHQRALTLFATPPTGQVYDQGSPQPTPTPGVRITAAPPVVNRTTVPLVGDPVASPVGWVWGSETSGNNTITGENRIGKDLMTNPQTAQASGGVFNFPLQVGFGAPDPLSFADAVNVNMFYWVNRAHDLHFQAGFDEAAGNYQQNNYTSAGIGGDPMLAYTHFGSSLPGSPLVANSSFFSPDTDDGSPGEVRMYLGYSGAAGFFTDGALDAEVIVHEYTHGVSTRLVRLGYTTFQGAAMGEAWSDFFALEYTIPFGSPPDGEYPNASYLFQSWGTGIRTRPYTTNMTVNPLTYSQLGHVLVTGPEVHADGEIWMEALWEARANLIQQFGETEGRRRIRLLVIDGMKLSPPAPTMVDARDAILLADRVDFNGASQTQLWTAFAKRGLGALAYSAGGSTVHVVSSFDMPSKTGQLKFHEDPFVIGETVRVLLSDSNNPSPTARIQLTGSSGDLEDVILARVGSLYVGSIPSSASAVARQDLALQLIPGDAITAYYVDADTGSGAYRLIQTTVNTRPAYSTSVAAPFFPGGNEQLLTSSAVNILLPLAFDFPFFSQKYSLAVVSPNGLVSFNFPVQTSCMDASALARYAGIAPMWMNLTFGAVQPNEGVYLSTPSPNAVTLRWAAETRTRSGLAGDPVNFAVTLTSDGIIQYFFGSGNQFPQPVSTPSGCGPGPVTGISNGHDAFTETFFATSLNNAAELKLLPPFNFSSEPVAVVETPAPGDTVKGVMTVSGVAYDPNDSIARVDILIDDVERALVRPTLSRPDFCAQKNVHGCPTVGWTVDLDIAGMGLAAGPHTLRAWVTNTRGAFFSFPDKPISFTVVPGVARLPHAAIETPAQGTELSGTATLRGYAYFDDLTVRRVDMLIDGVTYPGLVYGLSRTDICNPLPTPKPPNCPAVGWQMPLNTQIGIPPLPDGPHSMQLRIQDASGRYSLAPDTPVPFTVKNGSTQAPVGAVTSPQPNDQLNGTVTITGYAYSPGGRITSTILLVDGFPFASARYGLPQVDVCKGLTGVAACPNIGFSVALDTTMFANGPHVIGVSVRNDQGLSAVLPSLDRSGMNIFIQNP